MTGPHEGGRPNSGSTCAEVRKAILELPEEELTEEGTGPVAGHLAACPECRARAQRIREGIDALRGALIRTEPPMGPEEAEALAMRGRSAPGETPDPKLPGGRGPVRRLQGRWRKWKVALPAAAAAALALYLGHEAVRSPSPERPAPDPTAFQEEEPATRVHVEVAPEVRTVVLTSPDPKFTVVWLH